MERAAHKKHGGRYEAPIEKLERLNRESTEQLEKMEREDKEGKGFSGVKESDTERRKALRDYLQTVIQDNINFKKPSLESKTRPEIFETETPTELRDVKEIDRTIDDTIPKRFALFLKERGLTDEIKDLYNNSKKLTDMFLELASAFLTKVISFEDKFATDHSSRRSWKTELSKNNLPAYRKLEEQRVRMNSLGNLVSAVGCIEDIKTREYITTKIDEVCERSNISSITNTEAFNSDYENLKIQDRYKFINELSEVVMQEVCIMIDKRLGLNN